MSYMVTINASWFKRLLNPWLVGAIIILYAFCYYYIDIPIASYFYALNLQHKFPLLARTSLLGEGSIYICMFLFFALFSRYVYHNTKWERRFWFLWMVVLLTTSVCLILKVILGRARPELLMHADLYGFYGWHMQAKFWSFPSGHTTTLTGVFLGLACIYPRYFYMCLILTLCSISLRIILVNHYFSDIIGTFYLTLIELSGLLYFLQRKEIKYA